MGLWSFRVRYINMTLSVGCRCTGRVAVVPTPLCRKNCNTLENSPMEMSYSTLLLTFHSPRKARKRENISSHSKNIEQPFWVPQYDLCDLSRPHLSPAPPSLGLIDVNQNWTSEGGEWEQIPDFVERLLKFRHPHSKWHERDCFMSHCETVTKQVVENIVKYKKIGSHDQSSPRLG